jgi:PPM family protein phosphatase
VNIDVGVKTDIGRVRQRNEDSFLLDEPLYGVADGMGGQAAGDVASSTAVEVIRERARTTDSRDPDALVAIVREANSAIWKKAQADPSLKSMGTTCTLVMINNSTVHLAHVGDSRAYLLRGGELSQITEDHTLVARMVREGHLSADEAEHHPQRNIITRVLGVDSDVQVDISSFDLIPGDRLIVCSDGLTSMVGPDDILRSMNEAPTAQAAAEALVDLANQAGGEDNITVIVINVVDSNGSTPPNDARAVTQPGRTQPSEDEPEPKEETPIRAVPVERGQRPRYWLRRLIAVVLLFGVLVVGGWLAIRWQLGNSYFVGVAEDGNVTIFRGRPEDIAGISLRSEEAGTDLALEELPEFMRDDVQEGIKTDSLQEARERVATLQEQAEDFQQEGNSRPKKNN